MVTVLTVYLILSLGVYIYKLLSSSSQDNRRQDALSPLKGTPSSGVRGQPHPSLAEVRRRMEILQAVTPTAGPPEARSGLAAGWQIM